MNIKEKGRSHIIIIPFVLLFLIISIYSYSVVHNSGLDHNYFPELQEFSVRTTDDPSNPQSFPAYSMQATYVRQDFVIDTGEYKTQKTAYVFRNLETGTLLYLLFPVGISDHINMIPNKAYGLVYEVNYGWPTTTGLTISDRGKLVFAGISDWGPNRTVKIAGSLPFTVNQTRILADHYINGTNSDSWIRKTNTEISFTYNKDSAVAHQGQTVSLGGYGITPLLARDIQYRTGWFDAGQIGVSYIITAE